MTARAVRAAVALALLAAAVPSAAGKGSSQPKPGPARVVAVIEKIQASLKTTKYQHATRVRARDGEYLFDCSGMAEWILKRGAPAALAAVKRPEGGRPLAVHYYRTIARIKPGQRRGPWLRVADALAARPGDVIAWERPKWFDSKSTGHVAFVVSPPRLVDEPLRGVVVRVADASKFRHGADSKPIGGTGFGTGEMLLPVDAALQPTGYGWVGEETPAEWIVPAALVVGRPLR
jgi:hypothetical protein